MKQIDIIKTYAQKRCLIVDDVPQARAHLKRILVDFGVSNCDTAGNAEEAIDLCHKHSYDLVISDYNLGTGKNGQQLLEELRFHKLLRNTALYIMVTAEASSHYVLHALEYEPDDFLQKPISRDSLRPRLDLALLKNEHLKRIKEQLDKGRLDRAIAAGAEIAQKGGRFQNDARKILAELYLKQHRSDEAEAIYALLDSERLPLWAQLGLATVHYQRKDYPQAEETLKHIIEQHVYCVEAHDLLARIYQRTHRAEQSQQSLLNAVKISPRSAQRQRELGRVSSSINDDQNSIHAYRSALRHAKNSCYEAPDDFLNLAESLVRQAQKSSGSEARKLSDEAKQQLGSANKRYAHHPLVSMRNKLIEADLLEQQGKQQEAVDAIASALDMHANMKYSVIANTDHRLCLDCALAFMNRGRGDEGEAILQELARVNSDPELAIEIDKLLREPKTKEGMAYAAGCNKEGIELYRNGQYEQAIDAFREVLRELPNHVGLNLNFIQALTSKAKQKSLTSAELALLHTSFQRIGELGPDSPNQQRFDFLNKRYQKLVGQ
ncbi:tetratricopeptide repeat-containing response regulator [Agaribacterium haliotis]|uniref:tetratricopeptide repeat-containing response regulator n=1 Tax=Agaribacterium haliotis TaxID=2013869 RepID=UPI000BB56A9A|nr:tetratricopeptide repeat-containing response regulator [Agaribacterium haliotis]